ncbi:NYN domain-containing protein [Kitasatospora aureofaciens]|uniref:NYN domain-containing protein n=1 Tax=Kitasatospora aureofaciens TaxID=1894 RepID=A0A1E7N4G7_KITAU|nr:NYN domain-containing protein [Kitasatospora aureofaciens]OEV35586.1 NYN domain-containing protein [Kitasatospora aureofaciens]GGU61901.1 NYN domain-containing protein [Kitasatospora aureofaciens]
MDRCVVLVDAGYLLGAAASLLAGDPSRSKVTVNHTALISALRERAEAETGLPLLRIYWFDAAPDRRPMPEHRRLRVLPRVTVRLGALTRAEGRWVQKGVDAAMHAELSELARNRACADVVLITGDGDLLPGMMTAKEHGVAVHLWALQAADGDFNQSEDLVGEADERRVLDREWIEASFSLRDHSTVFPAPGTGGARQEIAKILAAPPASLPSVVPPVVRPAAAAAPEEPAANGRPQPAAALRVVPTPKDLAGRVSAVTPINLAAGLPVNGQANGHAAGHAAVGQPANGHAAGGPVLRWSSDRGWVDRPAPEPSVTAGDGLPTLAQLTTAEQRWADREEDITTIGGDAHEVGQVFARRWSDRLGDPERLTVLWPDYPRIPHRVDGELLRYAARFGLLAHKDDQIDEHDRYAIRAGFWKELALRVPGGSMVVDD